MSVTEQSLSSGTGSAIVAGQDLVTGNGAATVDTLTKHPEMVSVSANVSDASLIDDFLRIVPADYKDKPWVGEMKKNANPINEMFKSYEEAQKLIGSRPQGIIPPPDNATPEQMKAFYKSLGVPDSLDQYDVTPITWDETEKEIGELITKSRNDTVLTQLKKTAQENGITPKQLKALTQAYEKSQVPLVRDQIKAQAEKVSAENVEFSKMMETRFGANWEAVSANGRKLIDAFVPEDVKAGLKTADNKSLVALATALHSIHTQLVKSDSFTGTNNQDNSIAAPVETIDQVRARTRSLMSTKAYTDFQHPDHDKTVKAVKALQQSLHQFFKK